MLTKKEILEKLEKKGIFLGRSNPSRTFDFYRQLGLIDRQEIFRTKIKGTFTVVYPDNTVDLLTNIHRYVREGKGLSEIKKGLQASRGYRREWIQALKLDPSGIESIRIHMVRQDEMHYFVLVFYADEVHMFKVSGMAGLFPVEKNVKVLDKRFLSWEEFGETVKKVAIQFAKEKRVMIKDRDIILALFS